MGAKLQPPRNKARAVILTLSEKKGKDLLFSSAKRAAMLLAM
jgi:hypothetical protein